MKRILIFISGFLLFAVLMSRPVAAQSLLQPEDLTYVGSFRVPIGTFGESTFAYGGNALAFCADGDPDGDDDGYPGSFFIVGHDQHQLVAEVSIPVPVPHDGSAANLPAAELLQPFADVTGGLGAGATNDPRIGGLEVAEVPGLGPKLHWAVYRWYNVAGDHFAGHGWSDLDLSNPNAQGLWELGDYHNQQTAGYIFTAPEDFADQYLNGQRLVAGLNIQQGVATSSQGPALFSFSPWGTDQTPPLNGATLDTNPMLLYPFEVATIPDHKNPDEWEGGVWVEADGKEAVLIVGRKSMGPERYGVGEDGDCSPHQGYHGDPYEPQVLFYDPADLAASAQGQRDPWQTVPYARTSLEGTIIRTCEYFQTGAAYDSANQLLYILQPGADIVSNEFEPYPVINVFKIEGGNGEPQPPVEMPWRAFISFIGNLIK